MNALFFFIKKTPEHYFVDGLTHRGKHRGVAVGLQRV